MTRHWFIGADPRDELAGKVAVRSMLRHSLSGLREGIKVHFLRDHELRRAGLYWRSYEVRPNGQIIDCGDGKPCSTQFSFTRFLVPEIARRMGIHEPVLFTDPDVMFRAPIEGLFDCWNDSKFVMCVQHRHTPPEATKFDGLEQTRYFRKNWSSVMLLHPDRTNGLDAQAVNSAPGASLHALSWVKDKAIGALPPEWNHLVGYDHPSEDAKLAHFTLGTPDMPELTEQEYAEEWLSYVRKDEMPEAIRQDHWNIRVSA